MIKSKKVRAMYTIVSLSNGSCRLSMRSMGDPNDRGQYCFNWVFDTVQISRYYKLIESQQMFFMNDRTLQLFFNKTFEVV